MITFSAHLNVFKFTCRRIKFNILNIIGDDILQPLFDLSHNGFGAVQGLVGGYLSSILWERYFRNL